MIPALNYFLNEFIPLMQGKIKKDGSLPVTTYFDSTLNVIVDGIDNRDISNLIIQFVGDCIFIRPVFFFSFKIKIWIQFNSIHMG